MSADCGTFRVYENRTAPAGRTIVLHLIVLHAKHRDHRECRRARAAKVHVDRTAAAGLADGAFLKELAVLRDRHDIILLDNRGMGESHPLNCDLVPPANPAVYFRKLWPSALVSACHARHAAQSDLRQYTTANAADDLDELRAALGYSKLVLDGGSYGTYFSLVYAQRHPANVESLVLRGVVPPRLPKTFIGFAPAAQAALDKLAAECAADASCHVHFPQFRAHFAALVARLNREPIPVLVRNGVAKRVVTVALSKEVFVDTVRHVLYDIGAAAYVPYVVEQAYRRNTVPLGTLIDDTVQGFAQGLDSGALLSYSCGGVRALRHRGGDSREQRGHVHGRYARTCAAAGVQDLECAARSALGGAADTHWRARADDFGHERPGDAAGVLCRTTALSAQREPRACTRRVA